MKTNTNIELELELTFLARFIPQELRTVKPVELIDVYVPDDDKDHPRLRLRKKGNRYQITKKLPAKENDASVHTELSIDLTEKEFDALATCSNKRVIKDRYDIVIEGHPAEVDIFKGELDGLVLIDFEFTSEADKNNFKIPNVCLADVTQEDFIAGGLLAGKKYKDIEAELAQFNFTALNV